MIHCWFSVRFQWATFYVVPSLFTTQCVSPNKNPHFGLLSFFVSNATGTEKNFFCKKLSFLLPFNGRTFHFYRVLSSSCFSMQYTYSIYLSNVHHLALLKERDKWIFLESLQNYNSTFAEHIVVNYSVCFATLKLYLFEEAL